MHEADMEESEGAPDGICRIGAAVYPIDTMAVDAGLPSGEQ